MDEARLSHVKQRLQKTWTAGDFGQIARYTEDCPIGFVNRLQPQHGMKVLDVACGTGNLSMPAARAGADVSGVDIAENLLIQALARAATENLEIDFREGDAEKLPFNASEFDLVMSMFGAMFAPRPEVTAGELARVCRPGGRIAMANWTPAGFSGQMLHLGAKYIPPQEGIPSPMDWGNEVVVRQRLGPYADQIDCRREMAVFEYPFSPSEVVDFFRDYFGPVQMAFARLDADAGAAYKKDLIQLWSDNNLGTAQRTVVHSEFLEVIAVRNTGR